MTRRVVFLTSLWVIGCGADPVKEASCSEDGLATLQESCVAMGGDFSASTSASSLDECGASGSVGLGNGQAGGECSLKGEGECEVVCDLPGGGGAEDGGSVGGGSGGGSGGESGGGSGNDSGGGSGGGSGNDSGGESGGDVEVDDGTDSDGDGWTDFEEERAGTNPADRWDHPYEAGWPMDDCRGDVDPTVEAPDSAAVGDIVSNFSWDTYQYESWNRLKLHDFCDHVVILHSGMVYDLVDPPSDDEYTADALSAAAALQALYDEHRSAGLMVIQDLWIADDSPVGGSSVETEHLSAWAEGLGLAFPVARADGAGGVSVWFEMWVGGYVVIGRGGEVLQTDGDLETTTAVVLDALAR